LNSYSINNERVNDNIIITKDYDLLLRLIQLHDFNANNKNYLDINLYEYLKKNSICYEIIDLQYKLILSECNIIAISGDSGSGKTTLSNILKLLFEKDACLLETDRYHKWERGDENYKKYTHLDPYANHLEKMNEDIFQLKIGQDIYQVDYDHSSGKFTQKQKIETKKNVVLCGLHTLYRENTNELLNLKIYLDTDRDLMKKWKIQRDVVQRGYTLEKVLNQIEAREKDYNEFILKQKENADIVIQFYEFENELLCNFIIQNNLLKIKSIEKIISCGYKITYDNDKNLIIKLKNSTEHVDAKIINIVENNKSTFINNYFKEALNLIYYLV
jgi:uridine kinase